MEIALLVFKLWLAFSVVYMVFESWHKTDFFTRRIKAMPYHNDPNVDERWLIVRFVVVFFPAMFGLFFFVRGGLDTFIPKEWGAVADGGGWWGVSDYLAIVLCVACAWVLHNAEVSRRAKNPKTDGKREAL